MTRPTSRTMPPAAARAPRHRDEGSALLLVVGTMSALILLVSAALTYALQSQGTAQRARSYNQALAAAQAGVDDYLARLNKNENYWQGVDCTNIALKRPFTAPVPCAGWGAGAEVGWATVPGSASTAYPAQFHYDVLSTTTQSDGTIQITSTGRAGSVTRSVRVLMRRDGFGEFLYLSNYETFDPQTYPASQQATAADRCTHYVWEPLGTASKPRDTSYCTDIQFGNNDVLDGPVHSNDSIKIAGGVTFKSAVTTADPACDPGTGAPKPAAQCYRSAGGGTPTFERGIGYRGVVPLPESTANLRQYVSTTAADPGCLYTGPTRIKLLPPGASTAPGQMTVWSRWSAASTLNPGCGSAAALRSASGATVAVPTNKVVLVQSVPTGSAAPSDQPAYSSTACDAGAVDGSLPAADDWNRLQPEYTCNLGTVYVEGRLRGRLTIAADNNVVITNDLTHDGGLNGTDALGLIATNNVVVHHPVRQNDNGSWANLASPNTSGVEVEAAILTLKHSFTVQKYDVGAAMGTLKVTGSIAQLFRGPVSLNYSNGVSTGYVKDYHYDPRLKFTPPPYFLDPVKSAWGSKSFAEVRAAYGP